MLQILTNTSHRYFVHKAVSLWHLTSEIHPCYVYACRDKEWDIAGVSLVKHFARISKRQNKFSPLYIDQRV